VNDYLKSWKVPDNDFTREQKVTLRRILSHSAGLTVHGFPGYELGAPVPTLVQVLNGDKPANTEPIRVDTVPGTKWRYAGGGYTVMQQMLIDVIGQPFPELMQRAVLSEFDIKDSAYSQPLRQGWQLFAAPAYSADGKPVQVNITPTRSWRPLVSGPHPGTWLVSPWVFRMRSRGNLAT
jgi:CubicO group peptidase (beta-lactamase class C family)